jgi:alpha-beta hydrolase superfamily lysophospholipase
VIAGDHAPAVISTHAITLTNALKDAGVEVDCTLYDSARHELLNETNRDQIAADIITWMQGHI